MNPCTYCGGEVYNYAPGVHLMSMPPKIGVACKECGHRDYRPAANDKIEWVGESHIFSGPGFDPDEYNARMDAILKEDYEATLATVEQLETERECREAEWDYTAVKIGLAVVLITFAIAIPGIWWWFAKIHDAALFAWDILRGML